MTNARVLIAGSVLLLGGCELLESNDEPQTAPPVGEKSEQEPEAERTPPAEAEPDAEQPASEPEAIASATHSSVAASNIHTCAIKSGQVRCWGRLGKENFFEPQKIASQSAAVEVSSEGCVLGNNGDVSCWGEGEGTTLKKVDGLTDATAIASSSRQTCAVKKDGTVSCWKNRETPAPSPIKGVADAVDVAVGTRHACALRRQGEVVCWGRNNEGQLAKSQGLLSGDKEELDATAVEGISGVAEIDAGQNHTCARLEAGNVVCWGANDRRQSGSESGDKAPPTFVGGIEGATALVMGLSHSCAVVGGSLRCWGNNEHGQLGEPGDPTHEPVEIAGLTDVVSGAGGFTHTCVATTGGDVQCVGGNNFGQLGAKVFASAEDAGFSGATRVAVGGSMVCAVVGDDKRLDCRGDDRWEKAKPKEIGDARDVVEVAAGLTYTCVTEGAGKTTCFGFEGQVWEPVPGKALSGLSAESVSACGLTKRRELYCWFNVEGEGDKSRLGDVSRLSIVAAANGHRCMADTKGRTFCFGANDNGEMGTGRPGKDEGIAFPKGLGVVKQLDAGDSYTCARNKKNRVLCWGDYEHPERKPTDVKAEGAVEIAVGDAFGCARTEAGELSCWGNNDEGQLGDGTTKASEKPVKVANLDRAAVQISASGAGACAVLDDGQVTCWGKTPLRRGAANVITVDL